ncbi:MAG: UvrD-helicase domain-containing protein [Lachnospiraceae bacterium]|nr:UvrD-helicase domain-containing protein [Lachnospiraceae bacterium]
MILDNTLNPPQQEAVKHLTGPLLILAGAGSGKTRVITHRIAYLIEEYNVSPYNILAITFTNKAAKEMRERVDSLVDFGAGNIWVNTFHATCVRMLRKYGDAIGYNTNFSVYDTDDQKALMRTILKDRNIDPKKYSPKYFLSRISAAKNELVQPDSYASVYPTASADPRLVADIYREYQERLRANNAMDFDDLLVNTVLMLHTAPDVLNYYRNRFRYILVDEYQDTNAAQFEMIKLLAHYENDEGEVECNLCVVGDDDQSIYGFRGADIRNILDFEKNYPDAKVIKLEQNYRSTGCILDAANEIIKNNPHTQLKKLWTSVGEGSPITYTIYGDDMEEAAGVAEEIKDQVDSGKAVYSDFAVLYRTNAQSRAFETMLSKKRIPCKVIGNINFYQRKEIKDILAYLKTIDNGSDGIAVRRILNVPKRGIGDTTVSHLQDFADRNDCTFYDALTYAEKIPSVKRAAAKIQEFTELIEAYRKRAAEPGCSLKKLVSDLLSDLDYEEELRNEDPESFDDRQGNISELINAITYYEENAEEPPTLGGYLSDVSLVSDLDSVEENPDYVVLMTVHSAKGLEFNQVFLAGMEDGLFPSSMSIDEETRIGVEEERRLCYVGITRAKKHLFLSRANQRMVRGETTFYPESRFISELKKGARHLLSEKKSYGSGSYFGNSGSYGSRAKSDRYGENSGSRSDRDSYNSQRRSYDRYESSSRRDYESSSSGYGSFDFGFGGSARKPETKPYENPYKVRSVPVAKSIGSGDPSTLGYEVGDTVSHERFGTGTVKAIVRGGRDFEVTVEFATGTKKMLAAFAKLRKI